MRKRILSLILSAAMLLSFMPNFAFAQQAQDQGKALKSEIIEGKDGKAYTAYHLDGYTVADILGYGPRQRAAGEEIPGFTLQLHWVGRTLKEFPFPEGGIELRLTPKSDAKKVIATITYTKDDIYSEIVKDPDGTEHYVGRAKGLKPFKKTEAFTQALLDEGVDMQIPYGISFHPELFATTFGTQTFILSLEQKCNPLWTTEWNVSDKYKEEGEKPNILAFYADKGSPAESIFPLPKNGDVYSMQSNAPQGMYWDGKDSISIWDKSNANLHPVIVGKNAKKGYGKDYTGKLSDDALLLVSDAAQPRPFIGFGEGRDNPNNTGFFRENDNSPKFLLNTYPTPDQINNPDVFVTNKVTGKSEPAYRQIKRYAVYEALNVKFTTGNGKLTADGDKGVDIGQPQEIGYSEKIAGNESGRKITLPDDSKLIPPEKPEGQKTENEFKGWALTKDATKPLFKTQAEADQYAQAFEEDTTFHAIYGPAADYKIKVAYVDEQDKPIKDIYKIAGKEYPTEKPGKKDQEISAEHLDPAKAPKFIGYEILSDKVKTDPVPAQGEKAVYTTEGKYTVKFVYKKLDDIIPEDKASDDVKKTYIPVTWKIDKNKGEFKKDGAVVTNDSVKYYVNPVENKTFTDVVNKAGLVAASKDENKYKLNTDNPNTFDPAKVKSKKEDQEPTLTVEDGTEITNWRFTVEKGLEATVNFEETKAEQFKDKLKPVDIKVWKKDPIVWKEGVALKEANADLQKILDENTTVVTDENGRTSNDVNLPNGEKGNLKVTFSDGSSVIVKDQTLYVAGEKNDDNKNLPKDAVKVDFKIGEGVNGEAKTKYVKPGTDVKDDKPAVTLQGGYKNLKWYNGEKADAKEAVDADYTVSSNAVFVAKAILKGQGSAELAFVDDKGTAIDILNAKKDLQLPNQDYVQTAKGKDGTAIAYDKSKAPKILGYEFTNEEPVISPANFAEGSKATITLKYKKIDDIIGPNKPADQKPEGYVTVAFKATTGAELDPSEMSYFVNPKADVKAKVSKVGDNYQISGKKADGTDLTGNVPAVKSTDASKYELKYADADKKWAYDNFAKVDKDITADTTFTAQVITLGEPTVTFPNVEIEKGGSKVVTPEVRDKYGKKIAQPGKPEVKETPDGVKVTPNDDGTVKIEVPKNYKGNGSFTIKVTYKVDGKDVPGVINVKIQEDNPVEPKNYDGYINLEPVGEQEAKHATDIHVIYLYGYQDKTVHPQGDMTRAEAAAMVARLKNLDMSDTSKPDFKDCESRWYNSAINAVVKAGLMKGYPDGTFAPNGKITRAEFAQLIKGIDNPNTAELPFTDVAGHWGLDAISQAYANKRIMGYPDNTFKPNNDITRAEAVTILNSLFDRGIDEAGLANVRKDIVEFKDLDRSHWAYYQIVEASNTHEFYRAKDGEVPEVWVRVLKTWNDFLK
ncbi:S-layer homology domain-containing protein [Aedoeadaptatus coxii]|uniref:S-layer homology domain-containing protein n=1 Tax=Aedoeadaptatus coxii TaxID=755172 RepID=UPI002AD42368|nr:S-layer homology domain-containing protein [Peptoniphilus coxii]